MNGPGKSRRQRRSQARTPAAFGMALTAVAGLMLAGPAAGASSAAAGGSTAAQWRQRVLAVAEALDPAAPLPTEAGIAALATAHLSSARVGSVSVSVRDLTSQKELFSAGADQSLAPASTLKILTATAALTVLGPDTSLTTRVVLERTGPSSGTVTLVAGGDTTLAPDSALDQDSASEPGTRVMGYSGIGDLAWSAALELRRRGIETVEVQLDDTVFSGPAVYPDWEWTLGTTWGSPTAALAIMGGRAGAAFDATTFVADPALVAAEQFSRRLAAYGGDNQLSLPTLTVAGSVTRAAAPSGAMWLASVDSAPIRDLVAHMLRNSDNSMADALGRMAAVALDASGSFEGCALAVIGALDDLGVPVSGLRLEDCSGLSHGSAVSATTLTSALALVSGAEAGELGSIVRSLPVGGLQGTLIHRFNDSAAAGNLRAKTGTLTGVTSLAGLVQTTGGRELVFAVLANPDPKVIWTDSARLSIDHFVAGLAELP